MHLSMCEGLTLLKTPCIIMKSIEIPTRDGSEVVEVFLDELPEEAQEICEILITEEAPIELFKQFAVND